MPETQTKNNLQSFLEILNKGFLDKKDTLIAFEKVAELVLKIQKNQQEAIARLEVNYSQIIKTISEKHDISIKEFTKKTDNINKSVNEATLANRKEHKERLRLIDTKLASVKNGKNGTSIKNIYINDKGELIIVLE